MGIDASLVLKYGLPIALFAALGVALLQTALSELFGSNIRVVLEERGWDKFLLRTIDKLERRLFRSRSFWFVTGMLLGATIIVWVSPMLSAASDVPLKKQLDTVTRERDQLKMLLGSAATPDLKQLTNEQLRASALQFSDRLRQFADEVSRASFAQMTQMQEQEQKLLTPEDRDPARTGPPTKYQEQRSKDMDLYERTEQLRQSEYDTRYRPIVLQYTREICDREKYTKPCPTDSPANSPSANWRVGEVADFLVALTNNLPP